MGFATVARGPLSRDCLFPPLQRRYEQVRAWHSWRAMELTAELFPDGLGRNSEEAIKVLSNHQEMQWDLVFLDHDLEISDVPEGRNGQTVATAMRAIGSRAKKVIIQSRNTNGAEAMHGILHPHYKVVRASFRGTLDMIRAG
jgi:hypothetical protein